MKNRHRHCEAAHKVSPKQSAFVDCFGGPSALLAMTTILFCFAVPSAYAEGVDYSIEISQKFGRGLLNVISSPLEIPCGIRDDVSKDGSVGIATGFFKGFAFFARRILVGVTEVATFVIPMEATLPPVCAKKAAAAVQT